MKIFPLPGISVEVRVIIMSECISVIFRILYKMLNEMACIWGRFGNENVCLYNWSVIHARHIYYTKKVFVKCKSSLIIPYYNGVM